jgi:Ca2+-binding RTX toxin-like protein
MAEVHGTDANDLLHPFFYIISSGSDTIYGHDGDDWISGIGGADTIYGGNDDDRLKGGGGADNLYGGAGVDAADYSDSGEGVIVSLETGDGSYGTAEGDELSSIESLIGSNYADGLLGDAQANALYGEAGNDTLKGGGGADTLHGWEGADALLGGNGSDTLRGENGQDTLNGGNGRDFLYGGNDADSFVWWDANETGLTTASADVIRDFNGAQGDEIDLSSIDADVYAGGNQAFTYIGTGAFSGTPGEIRYYHSGGNTYIEMQTGNAVDVEGVIRLDGIHNPTAGWFVL